MVLNVRDSTQFRSTVLCLDSTYCDLNCALSGILAKILNHSLSGADGNITSAQQEISVENSSQPIVVSPESLTVVQQEVKPVSDNLVLIKIDYIRGR